MDAITVGRFVGPFFHVIRWFILATTIAAIFSLIFGVYFRHMWIRSFYSKKQQSSGILGIYQYYFDKMQK